MKKPQTLLVIPCYNEQESIRILLDEIISLNKNYATLVIDDCSKDETYTKAAELSRTVRLIKNLGIGGAVQTGIKYAIENKFKYCIQIDGDGQHLPSEIARLIRCHEETGASIVIGSRYLKNDSFRSTAARRLGSAVIAQVLNLLFSKSNVTDPTSGMRLMDRNAMRLFCDNYPHDYPEPISLAWALNAGLDIAECDVKMRDRSAGKSSITGLKPIAYMLRVVTYIVLERIAGPRVGKGE